MAILEIELENREKKEQRSDGERVKRLQRQTLKQWMTMMRRKSRATCTFGKKLSSTARKTRELSMDSFNSSRGCSHGRLQQNRGALSNTRTKALRWGARVECTPRACRRGAAFVGQWRRGLRGYQWAAGVRWRRRRRRSAGRGDPPPKVELYRHLAEASAQLSFRRAFRSACAPLWPKQCSVISAVRRSQ